MDKVFLVCQGNILHGWNVIGCFRDKIEAFKIARDTVRIHNEYGKAGLVGCRSVGSPSGEMLVSWSNNEWFFVSLNQIEVK